MVIFNTSSTKKSFLFDGAEHYQLHSVQKTGADDIVRKSEIITNTFVVPALTTAVFVK